MKFVLYFDDLTRVEFITSCFLFKNRCSKMCFQYLLDLDSFIKDKYCLIIGVRKIMEEQKHMKISNVGPKIGLVGECDAEPALRQTTKEE